VLFFIELSTRRVQVAGCTAKPDSAWVTQQARNFWLHVDGQRGRLKFMIHDRDKKFCGSFDEVFASEGVEVLRTPIRAPKSNAVAERWVRTVREECLDWLLISGRRHLEAILRVYVHHYNQARPHRGLELRTPNRSHEAEVIPLRIIARRDRLGGLIHEYYPAA
jgi:putative transposase